MCTPSTQPRAINHRNTCPQTLPRLRSTVSRQKALVLSQAELIVHESSNAHRFGIYLD